MATNGDAKVERLRIGHRDGELGVIALRAGRIEIEHATSNANREKLARLLASLYHSRFKDEAALFHSLTARLNNGYMWAHEVKDSGESRTDDEAKG